MREQDEPTSSTGSLHSASPLLQVEQSIRSEIGAISPFVDKLMVFIKKCQCVAGNEIDVEISLREALANGVVHGNHEDPGKQVYVISRRGSTPVAAWPRHLPDENLDG
jgi:hypothetical protein